MNLEFAIRILDPATISDAVHEIEAEHKARHGSAENLDGAIYSAIRKARAVACQIMRKELESQVEPVWTERSHTVHAVYEDGTSGYIEETFADWCCPNCGAVVGEQYIKTRHSQRLSNYCHNCGVRIAWTRVKSSPESLMSRGGNQDEQDKD